MVNINREICMLYFIKETEEYNYKKIEFTKKNVDKFLLSIFDKIIRDEYKYSANNLNEILMWWFDMALKGELQLRNRNDNKK